MIEKPLKKISEDEHKLAFWSGFFTRYYTIKNRSK